MKALWITLVVVALLVIAYLFFKRSKTVIVKAAPSSVPPAPSSLTTGLSLAAAGVGAATSLFDAFSSDDADD